MTPTVGYLPGDSWLVSGERSLVYLSGSAADALRWWPAVRAGADAAELIGRVHTDGVLGSDTPLAIVCVEDRGDAAIGEPAGRTNGDSAEPGAGVRPAGPPLRVLVQGEVEVVIEAVTGERSTITGAGLITWSEVMVPGAAVVYLGCDDPLPDAQDLLPMPAGVVRSGAARWQLADSVRPGEADAVVAEAAVVAEPAATSEVGEIGPEGDESETVISAVPSAGSPEAPEADDEAGDGADDEADDGADDGAGDEAGDGASGAPHADVDGAFDESAGGEADAAAGSDAVDSTFDDAPRDGASSNGRPDDDAGGVVNDAGTDVVDGAVGGAIDGALDSPVDDAPRDGAVSEGESEGKAGEEAGQKPEGRPTAPAAALAALAAAGGRQGPVTDADATQDVPEGDVEESRPDVVTDAPDVTRPPSTLSDDNPFPSIELPPFSPPPFSPPPFVPASVTLPPVGTPISDVPTPDQDQDQDQPARSDRDPDGVDAPGPAPQDGPTAAGPTAAGPTAAGPTAKGPTAAGDHDGHTQLAESLPTDYRPPPMPPAPGPGQVYASMCPAGHANAPHSQNCRACGAPVPAAAPILTDRPLLGRIRLSTGASIDIDRRIVIGRAPSVSRASSSDMPQLVTVPSPHQDVSRSHVEVRTEDWHLVVADLNSTNGTVVQAPGRPERLLHPGQSVVVEVGWTIDLGDGVTFGVERPA